MNFWSRWIITVIVVVAILSVLHVQFDKTVLSGLAVIFGAPILQKVLRA